MPGSLASACNTSLAGHTGSIYAVALTADGKSTWAMIENDLVNLRWQQEMSAYFAPLDEHRPNERFPMLEEVFYLP